MNLLGMNRTQQTLLFINEAMIILIETFLKKGSFNTGGSNNTGGSILTGGSFSTSRLNFHIHLKSVILFLFDFKKSSCLGEKDSHFCLVYAKVYFKKIFFILFHVRGHGSFPGLIFHIQDVENEPPVIKEIPPLLIVSFNI